MTEAAHPFSEIEGWLASPAASGILLLSVAPSSSFAAAGIVAGETIVGIDGAAGVPTRQAFHQSIRKMPDGPEARTYAVHGRDGVVREVDVTLPAGGVGECSVTAGICAWDATLPDDAEPDFSGLSGDVDIFLRNSLGDERAGHEILRVRPGTAEGTIDVDIFFRLGGDDGQGGTWDYQTRAQATLRLAPGLPAVRTAFWEMGRLAGDLRLVDGVWSGEKDGPDGTRVPVELASGDVPICTAYMVTLLPLTLPLREGARLTFVGAGDGQAKAQSRQRFECTGRESVQVDGADVSAWCFRQRHYGLAGYGGDEAFYVTDDRSLVRVDWGPNYAGCWGEAVAPDQVNAGVPEAVHFNEQ